MRMMEIGGARSRLAGVSLLMWILAASARGTDQAPDPADWLTDGGDAQRTGWQQHETVLSTDTIKDMRLLWKIHLDNQPREMHALFPPLIAGRVTTALDSKEVTTALDSKEIAVV